LKKVAENFGPFFYLQVLQKVNSRPVGKISPNLIALALRSARESKLVSQLPEIYPFIKAKLSAKSVCTVFIKMCKKEMWLNPEVVMFRERVRGRLKKHEFVPGVNFVPRLNLAHNH
jgi:hypothetical protein